jgi:D-methionine transport system ATP-binding protein
MPAECKSVGFFVYKDCVQKMISHLNKKLNAIELKNVSKAVVQGKLKTEILKNIQINIPRGSIVGLIGKSGAGKTTLLRCLNLLERPDSGQVRVNGQDLMSLSNDQLMKVRQKMGMVFQSFHLLNSKTVFKNIALPLEILGLSREEISLKVNEVAELVGLEGKLNHYPSQLSGGQKQRVAIARALATHSDILLCDEFTSALDPETTIEILNLIRDIKSRLGITIVLVTHDMSVVKKICDMVFVVETGEVVETGSVQEILYSPKHPATQRLVSIGV